ATGQAQPFDKPGLKPALKGSFETTSGTGVPVFELMARRYLADEHSPDAVAGACGIDAATIRRIAAELADVAFNQAIEVAQPWTDFRGERHER
ncbi:MAG: formate dehydrogenase, partial [Xanthomonadales bacterium]|nr:formate dehydrogenase [Xanthomonadales bacterium]